MAIKSFIAASAFAGLALAAPQAATPKLGFTVNQAVPKAPQAPAVHLASAYAKYGASPPSDVVRAAASGSVVATPEQYDTEYLCPVTVGGQTLNLDFDTGSADL